MLLVDILYPLTESNAHLVSQLRDATMELNRLRSMSRSISQSGRSAEYDDQLRRAEAAVAVARAELAADNPSNKEEEHRDWRREFAAKRAAETGEQRRDRLGSAISAGYAASREMGSWEEKAKRVNDIYREMSGGGQHRVTADDIAHKLGGDVTPRTINKWLERPEFRRTAQLMRR